MTVREAIGSHGIESGFGNRAVERRVSRLRFRRLEWRMAIRNVLRRPGRSILTVSVIALSVASLLAAVSARTAVNRAIDEIYGIYAMDAWVSFSPRADVRMAPRLETLEGVSIAEPWQLADGYISLTATRFWGIPADTVLYQYALEQGRWYDEGEDDAVVISTDLAALLDLSTGDVVKIGVADKVREVRIVGLTVDNTIFLGGQLSGKVFMPPPLFAAISGRSGTGDLFAAALIGNQQQVAQDIEYRFSGQSASTQLLSDEIEAASEASSYLTFALAAMVILMSLLGALGIVNTVSLNLLDRRREIAVMRAIGARKSTLSLVYAMEGLVMGFFGWGIGLLVGVPVSGYIIAQLEAVLFDLQFSLGYLLILGAAAFAVALSSGAGVMAFVRGAKSTAEGLDYE